VRGAWVALHLPRLAIPPLLLDARSLAASLARSSRTLHHPCCNNQLLHARAPRRILTKLPGVTAVETDVAAKAVAVTLADGADTTQEALLEALLKWGKAAGKEVALAGQ
jgi:hypothetical protein